MESLGLYGIIKLSAQIIVRNFKHFLCLALVLCLPSLLAVLLDDAYSGSRMRAALATISALIKQHFSKDAVLPLSTDSEEPTFEDLQPQHPPSLALSIALTLFSMAVSLTCTPVLTFSVCKACAGQSVDMKSSVREIRRSVLKLVVTVLCVMVVMVVVGVIAGVVVVGVVALERKVGGSVLGVVVAVLGLLGLVAELLYLVVELMLAYTVSILEEEWGFGALKRSMYLLKGWRRKGMALGLWMLIAMCGLLLLPLVGSGSKGVQVMGVGMQSLLRLFNMVAQVVLYMACRARASEPIHTLLALVPTDSKGAHFPNYLDIKTAALSVA